MSKQRFIDGYEAVIDAQRLKRICVVSMFAVQTWRPDRGERYAVISLIDCAGDANRLPKRAGFVRRLIIRADDSTPGEDFDGDERLWHALTGEQAGEIVRFAMNVRGLVDVLLVHCVAGKSRSPAVAMAIAEAFGIGNVEVASQDAIPNGHVLALMREAFGVARGVQ